MAELKNEPHQQTPKDNRDMVDYTMPLESMSGPADIITERYCDNTA